MSACITCTSRVSLLHVASCRGFAPVTERPRSPRLKAGRQPRRPIKRAIELRSELVHPVAPVDHRSPELTKRPTANVDPRRCRHARSKACSQHGLDLALPVEAGWVAETREAVGYVSLELPFRSGNFTLYFVIRQQRQPPVGARVCLDVDEAAGEQPR